MYTWKDLVSNNKMPVYVHLSDSETAKEFLMDVEKQGFLFPDGSKPTEKMPDSFFALHSDMTINYIGTIGRIAYQCKAGNLIRMEK